MKRNGVATSSSHESLSFFGNEMKCVFLFLVFNSLFLFFLFHKIVVFFLNYSGTLPHNCSPTASPCSANGILS